MAQRSKSDPLKVIIILILTAAITATAISLYQKKINSSQSHNTEKR